MDLAELLVEGSTWAWRFLDSAEQAGFAPREETITEHLLVEMVEKAPGQVRVHKTTSSQESDTGADLALGIQVRSGLWLSLLIQAKKLDYRSGTYRELAKASAFTQVAHLIAHAKRTGSVPLYLLYNGSTLAVDGSPNVLGGCSLRDLRRGEHGPAWLGESPLGCTVIAAEEVSALLGSGLADSPASMTHALAPWECLLCPFAGKGSRPEVLPWPEYIRREGLIESEIDVPWLGAEPRPWLAALLTGADPEDAENAPVARYFAAFRMRGTD